MPRKPGKPGQLGDVLRSAHAELIKRAPRFSDEEVVIAWRAIRDYALYYCLVSASKGEASGTGAMSGLAANAQTQLDNIMDRRLRDEMWGDIDPTRDDGKIIVHHTPLDEMDDDEDDEDQAQ